MLCFIFNVTDASFALSFLCIRHIWVSDQLPKLPKSFFRCFKGLFTTSYQYRLTLASDACGWTFLSLLRMIGLIAFFIGTKLYKSLPMLPIVLLPLIYLMYFLITIICLFFREKVYFANIYLGNILFDCFNYVHLEDFLGLFNST